MGRAGGGGLRHVTIGSSDGSATSTLSLAASSGMGAMVTPIAPWYLPAPTARLRLELLEVVFLHNGTGRIKCVLRRSFPNVADLSVEVHSSDHE